MPSWRPLYLRVLICIALPVLTVAKSAEASNPPEPTLGTIEADSEPYVRDGRLVGCTLEWRNVLEDDLNGNRLIVVDALLTFATKGQQMVFSLKTVPRDAQQDETGALQTAAFTPVYAYPVFGGYSGAHKESYRYACDGPGFCAAYTTLDSIAAMIKAVTSGYLEVWFQRTPESLDVASPTHLETGPRSPVRGFGLCMMGMLDQLK